MQMNGDLTKNSFANGFTVKVDAPAMYRIRFIGALEDSWSERLGGLKITSIIQRNSQTITTLSGPLADQTALFEVLKELYDLRLPLLSVVCQDNT